MKCDTVLLYREGHDGDGGDDSLYGGGSVGGSVGDCDGISGNGGSDGDGCFSDIFSSKQVEMW